MKLKYLVIVMILVMSLVIVGCKKAPEPAAPTGPTPEEKAAQEQKAAQEKQVAEQKVAEAKAAEEAAAAAAAEEEIVEIPETEMGPGIVSDDAIQTGDYTQHSLLGDPTNEDAEHARDITDEPERFSNFDCVLDEEMDVNYISIKVTNTNSDMGFMISPDGVKKGYNTYFMVRGMVDKDPGCTVEELAPGESTVCDKIGLDDERFGNPAGTNRITIQSPDNGGATTAEAVVVNCPE
ncbi:hypothetical protein ACFL0V_06880 [Nanoarchaeota archaeon]